MDKPRQQCKIFKTWFYCFKKKLIYYSNNISNHIERKSLCKTLGKIQIEVNGSSNFRQNLTWHIFLSTFSEEISSLHCMELKPRRKNVPNARI